MMNLALLYWAAEISWEPRFPQIAVMYANTMMKYFVCPDGSVNHIVSFDPETGEMKKVWQDKALIRVLSGQGNRDWQCTVLQSVISIQESRNILIQRKNAHYCIANIPKRYYSSGFPSAGNTCMGRLLRCVHNYGRIVRTFEACSGGRAGTVSGRNCPHSTGNRWDTCRLEQKMRCNRAELFVYLSSWSV